MQFNVRFVKSTMIGAAITFIDDDCCTQLPAATEAFVVVCRADMAVAVATAKALLAALLAKRFADEGSGGGWCNICE
jgi:hypothetical protein